MRCQLLSAAVALVVVSAPLAATETEFGAKLFFDVTRASETVNGARDAGFGVDVTRFYFELDHRLDPTWSLHFTSDFSYSSSDENTQIFVKKAYVEGRFSPAFKLRIGAASLPWVPLVEKTYGYRYVEKVMVDRVKFGTSTDWGLHAGGKLGDAVGYAVAVVNGRGYRNPGRGDGVDVEARLAWTPLPRLTLALGGYSGRLGHGGSGEVLWHTARRLDAMAAWRGESWLIGGAYFRADDWRQVTAPAGDNAAGWSLWASGALRENLEWFVRVDDVATSRELDPVAVDDYRHAGVAYRIAPGFDLALAWKQRDRDSASGSRRANEVGVWGQVRF